MGKRAGQGDRYWTRPARFGAPFADWISSVWNGLSFTAGRITKALQVVSKGLSQAAIDKPGLGEVCPRLNPALETHADELIPVLLPRLSGQP
jgi:hypothetical protein